MAIFLNLCMHENIFLPFLAAYNFSKVKCFFEMNASYLVLLINKDQSLVLVYFK